MLDVLYYDVHMPLKASLVFSAMTPFSSPPAFTSVPIISLFALIRSFSASSIDTVAALTVSEGISTSEKSSCFTARMDQAYTKNVKPPIAAPVTTLAVRNGRRALASPAETALRERCMREGAGSHLRSRRGGT